ncbi:hypothetical protein THICB2_730127 [Thiomonas sp. CB2]|nr:hypothetical protein THICB2_730127 [Thiomonas sp. CB2]
MNDIVHDACLSGIEVTELDIEPPLC